MQYCENCGSSVGEGINFCPSCGKAIQRNNKPQEKNNNQTANSSIPRNAGEPAQNNTFNFNAQDLNDKIQNFNNTKDYSAEFDPADIQANKVFALFSYIGFLFIVPLLGVPNSKFARFHANQGLILFIFNVVFNIILSIISAVFKAIPFLGWVSVIIDIFKYILSASLMIIGIVNTVEGKAKELPVIGKFTILK